MAFAPSSSRYSQTSLRHVWLLVRRKDSGKPMAKLGQLMVNFGKPMVKVGKPVVDLVDWYYSDWKCPMYARSFFRMFRRKTTGSAPSGGNLHICGFHCHVQEGRKQKNEPGSQHITPKRWGCWAWTDDMTPVNGWIWGSPCNEGWPKHPVFSYPIQPTTVHPPAGASKLYDCMAPHWKNEDLTETIA